MKITERINKINKLDFPSPRYLEDEMDISDMEQVSTVDMDEHRWYTIATVVYEFDGGFIGVRGPVSLKSEQMGYDDIGSSCCAFEMYPVSTVTYKKKGE